MRSGLAVAALLLPALVACDGERARTAGPPAEAVTRAADRTEEARTARVSLRIEGGGRPGGGGTSGVVDMRARTGDLTVSATSGGRTVDFQILVVGRTGYAKVTPEVDEWHEIDLGAADGEGGLVREIPTTAVAFVRGATGEVRRAGSEKVRGTSTTRYDATFDLAKAADATPDDRTAKDVRGIASYIRTTTVPGSVWLDGDGRVRRVRVTYDATKIGDPELRGDMTMTLELWDFGVTVDVRPPPPSQVYEAPSPTPSKR